MMSIKKWQVEMHNKILQFKFRFDCPVEANANTYVSITAFALLMHATI